MSTLWNSRYANRTAGIKSSAIRKLLKITQKPEIISFGGGLPPQMSFP
jgi:2-aminoadipate transaminase